jgi:short-chain fatty acids transporter
LKPVSFNTLQEQFTMIKKLTLGFDSLMRKYTPDPFIYALMLTVLVFVLGVSITEQSILKLAQEWGRGFWSLATFTLQMLMILFLGYVVALSPLVKTTLSRLSHMPKNLLQAAVFATLISLVGALLNWGFGLIVSALFCRELGKRFRGSNFHILVACSYAGFLVWHGGLSGSIPLVVSTPGNFSQQLIGGLVPLKDTLFSTINLSILLAHFICLPLVSYCLMKYNADGRVADLEIDPNPETKTVAKTPAEALENSRLITTLIVTIPLLYLVANIADGSLSVDLNQINLLFFVMALILHKTPRAFLDACQQASQKIWPILVQYPFYAGIMAIMQESGLAAIMSNWFVSVASAHTLPFFVYLSAGLINIFIPSGGGQWAVQGPMVINAATTLSADLNATMMAVAWGDAWTNMIQPFWALPVLAIAGLKAKDIMGSLVYVFLVSGVITSLCFLVLA